MDCARGFLRDLECDKKDQQALEYLKLRQNLKEAIRKEMQDKSGSVFGHCQQKNELPSENYGSFFGPSQPSIARRVIQEATEMLEVQLLATDNNKKSPLAISSATIPGLLDSKPKIQKLKEARDYSFLLSDDAKPLVPTTEKLPSTKISASGVPSSKVPSKTIHSVHLCRKVKKSQKEKKQYVTVAHQLKQQAHSHELSLKKRLSLASANARKTQYVEIKKECPEKNHKMKSKQLQSSSTHRLPDGRTDSSSKLQSMKGQQFKGKKEISEAKKIESKPNMCSSSRKHQPQDGRKAPLLKSQSLLKQQVVQEKKFHEPKYGTPKHQELKQTKRQRQDDSDSDEDVNDISSIIRKIFRYDPLKHVGIDGDHDRLEESKFDDIQEEEERSGKLARKEDEIERRRNEEEERQERLRREAKKLKMLRH